VELFEKLLRSLADEQQARTSGATTSNCVSRKSQNGSVTTRFEIKTAMERAYEPR
jgi:hypothetical protein